MLDLIKNIVFFPKYSPKGASSRYRIYEYLNYFDTEGINYSVFPLFEDWYLDSIHKHKSKLTIFPKLMAAYIKRLYKILTLKKKSIAYIGAELFPYLPYGFEKILKFKRIPYIIEFDDAIFHNYDKFPILRNKTGKVIKNASHVITGSRYLSDYARQFNVNVTQIPTCIDAEKYRDAIPHDSNKFIIGWIGSYASTPALLSVVGALKKLAKYIDFELRLIGFDPIYTDRIKDLPFNLIEWSEDSEVKNMLDFSVGIMPLKDTPFSRGKCAFKLVQYMAVGIPTISTPLQSNIDIDNGIGNLFATTEDEWINAFLEIAANRSKFKSIGQKNKQFAMDNYTFQTNYRKHLHILSEL